MTGEVRLAAVCDTVPVVDVAARRRPCGEMLTMLDGNPATAAFVFAVACVRVTGGAIGLTLPSETG